MGIWSIESWVIFGGSQVRSEGISFDLLSPVGTVPQGVPKGKTGKALTTRLAFGHFLPSIQAILKT